MRTRILVGPLSIAFLAAGCASAPVAPPASYEDPGRSPHFKEAMCRETSSLGTRPGPRFLGGALELVGLSWTEPIPGAPVLSVTLENVSSSELTGRAGCLVCFPISYGRTTAPGPGDADHPFEFSLERVAPRGRTVVQLPVDREEGMPLLAVWWR